MGDPSKVILLEAMLKVIRDEDLLGNVTRVGKKLVQGMTDLQVLIYLACFIRQTSRLPGFAREEGWD